MKVGIYFDKGGGERGGPYVRTKLLAKYIPYVEIFSNIKKASEYDLLDFQWRVPKQLESYKHLCTFHGIVPLKYCSNLHAKMAMWLRTQEQRRVLKTARAIIAVSKEAERQLASLTRKKAQVIYAGFEPGKYKIKKKQNKALFLNSLERYENLQVVLDALSYSTPDVIVNVYGYGRMQKDYEKQIEEINLPVKIRKEVDNNIIIKELATSKFLLQPASCETFGLPVCEAMASGTIAIISDIPSHRENFTNVLFFNPDDPVTLAQLIKEVLANKHDYLIEPALKEVKEKYNVKRFIEETRKIYEEVLND